MTYKNDLMKTFSISLELGQLRPGAFFRTDNCGCVNRVEPGLPRKPNFYIVSLTKWCDDCRDKHTRSGLLEVTEPMLYHWDLHYDTDVYPLCDEEVLDLCRGLERSIPLDKRSMYLPD